MISFTVLAFEVVLWQSSDISVSIVSNPDTDGTGNGDVSISVLNTAGSTLLFYENAEMSGKIEYLGEQGWEEYCDISYTADNATAISREYGGLFAELEPGESWKVSVPEEAIIGMQNGTYRIKMTYISAKKFKQYMNSAFENRNDSEASESDISGDLPLEESEAVIGSDFEGINNSLPQKPEDAEESEPEKFLAASLSEVFVKTFDFTASETFVSEVSIDKADNRDINEKIFEHMPVPAEKRSILEFN